MKNGVRQLFIIQKIVSILTILLGVILLIYMITVEDEPGALPLLLIIIGTLWYFVISYRMKKQIEKNKE